MHIKRPMQNYGPRLYLTENVGEFFRHPSARICHLSAIVGFAEEIWLRTEHRACRTLLGHTDLGGGTVEKTGLAETSFATSEINDPYVKFFGQQKCSSGASREIVRVRTYECDAIPTGGRRK
jgi:hypothetical protein